MEINKEEFLNRCNSGLTMCGLDDNGDMDWMGEDHNWTAFQWLEDGVSPFQVHDYLVARG